MLRHLQSKLLWHPKQQAKNVKLGLIAILALAGPVLAKGVCAAQCATGQDTAEEGQLRTISHCNRVTVGWNNHSSQGGQIGDFALLCAAHHCY